MRRLAPLLCLLALSCAESGTPAPPDAGPLPDLPRADLPPGADLPRPADGGLPDQTSGDLTPAPDGPTLLDNTLAPGTWFERAVLAADRTSLAAAFSQAGYSPPSGTFLLAAQVLPGLGQPAFRYLSLGESGFDFSDGSYWPASTVKLTAAVGALWTLGQLGLSGAASVSFTDDDGAYSGTVKGLYDKALSISDNVAYNRLMEIAGFDPLNDQLLVPAQSLPKMVLQRRYTHPLPTSNLRTSPPISYAEGTKSGTIPQRVGVGQHPSCPDEGNCTTLFELLDVMRRVTLHDELPAGDRFPLGAADVGGLHAALVASDTDFLEPGASQALGHPALIMNKPGAVYSLDRLDHGLIEDSVTKERFLVAWSMPYAATSDAMASELTRRALLALKAGASQAPPLQRDAGVSMLINVEDNGPGASAGTRSHTFTISAPGADSLELWLDRFPLPAPTKAGPVFVLTHALYNGGERLLVVRALAAGKLVGYRAARVKLTPP